MATSKKLAEYCDYDPIDCTSVGDKWTLYADGRVSAERRSCWARSRTGTRYVSQPGKIGLESIDPDDQDNDAESRLVALADSLRFADLGELGWRKVRGGWIVR